MPQGHRDDGPGYQVAIDAECTDPRPVPRFRTGQLVTARDMNRLVDAANRDPRTPWPKYARLGAAVETPAGVMGVPVEP